MSELTEERLAEFERNDYGPAVAELVAEVWRLRKILDGEHHKPGAFDRMTDWAQQMENERDEARALVIRAVHCMQTDSATAMREFEREMCRLFAKWSWETEEQRRLSSSGG